jgi:hypothetical protein
VTELSEHADEHVMTMLEDLQRMLAEFNRDYPRPGLPPLVLSEPYDLIEHWQRKMTWPSSNLPGIYVVCDGAFRVWYIGKSSWGSNIGSRLGAHFKNGADKLAESRYQDWREAKLRYVLTIGLPPAHSFEAPAIEEYLVTRSHGLLNVHGMSGER